MNLRQIEMLLLSRCFFLLVFLGPSMLISQQRLHITAFGGFANYSGDLQTKRITLDQSNAVFGLGAKYDLTNHFSIRAGLNMATVKGTDKKNDGLLKARNLSFQSRILEANVLVDYNIFDLNVKRFTPFVFAGIAVYRFNPFTYDTLGNKIMLQPLSTEGQGLPQYPDRKPYSLTQLAIPFGGGIKIKAGENVLLSFEMGLRKLFTDYLDDVSSTYVDESLLFQARGPVAVGISYRGDELKDGNPSYPANLETRGGAKFKDWYYFTGVGISIGIGSGSAAFRGRVNRGSTDCPTNL